MRRKRSRGSAPASGGSMSSSRQPWSAMTEGPGRRRKEPSAPDVPSRRLLTSAPDRRRGLAHGGARGGGPLPGVPAARRGRDLVGRRIEPEGLESRQGFRRGGERDRVHLGGDLIALLGGV